MSTFLKSAEKLLEIMTDAELEAEFSMIEEWLVSVKHVLLGTHGIDNVVLRSRFRFRQEEQELMYRQGFPGQTKDESESWL
jgi:hypothetical protein